MGAGHDHRHGTGPGSRPGARYRRRLAVSLGLIGAFFVVELVVALTTGSLALLSDAGHMLTDVLGLGMALAAVQLADRHERGDAADHRTFGLYRLEILAAFVNALLLVGIGVYVLVEAILRFGEPTDIDAGPVLVAAVLGLVVNLVVLGLLRGGRDESLNVEAASMEVLADTLGSVAVVTAAAMIAVTDWTWVDPLFGALVGVFIIPRAVRLGIRAARVLIQAAPDHLDLSAIEHRLATITGVVDVHDLHVWTLTSGMDVATVHLMYRAGGDHHGVLDRARALLEDEYGITHATLQVEPDDHTGCHEVGW